MDGLLEARREGRAPGAHATDDAPMFDRLDPAHAEIPAAQSCSIVLPAGQVLFRRGTASTGFYVVRGR